MEGNFPETTNEMIRDKDKEKDMIKIAHKIDQILRK